MSISYTAAVEAFLAEKRIPGCPADAYAIEQAFVDALAAEPRREPCPQLPYRQTIHQATPDPREKAVEAVLTAAGDYDDIDLALAVIGGLRPDLDRALLLHEVHYLYELSDEVFRAQTRGDRALSEHFADAYENALADLVGGA